MVVEANEFVQGLFEKAGEPTKNYSPNEGTYEKIVGKYIAEEIFSTSWSGKIHRLKIKFAEFLMKLGLYGPLLKTKQLFTGHKLPDWTIYVFIENCKCIYLRIQRAVSEWFSVPRFAPKP